MPLIPQTWLNAQTVNTTTENLQFGPNIAQLANGNILVTWTANEDIGAASPAGFDILGQLFNPMGAKIGTDFIVNHASTFDNELRGDIVTLPGGGYIVVYHDSDLDDLGGSNIRLEEFNSAGVSGSDQALVVSDNGAPLVPNYNHPRGAASSDTSVMIVYDKIQSGSTSVYAKIYDPSTNTYGSEFIVLTGTITNRADIAVLNNGNYVVVANTDATDDRLVYRIFNSAGAPVTGATFVTDTNINTNSDDDAAVTALTGGGFVISWASTDSFQTDIVYAIYDAAGALIFTNTIHDNAANSNNIEPAITGLADGSFVVVYDDERLDVATAVHISPSGTELGAFNFDVASSRLSITDLADGRFAVAYELDGGEIKMEILDTRDDENATGVYAPDDWQVGTIFADVISATAAIVHGHSGNDNISDNLNTAATLYGDMGDDRINVLSNIGSDAYYGGAGNDVIDWSGDVSDGGAVFNLALGTAVSGFETEVMLGFENILGTNVGCTLIGNATANYLLGGLGNDTLNGAGGADIMTGGQGNDDFYVDNIDDVIGEVIGAGGNDRVIALVNYVLIAGSEVERLLAAAPAGAKAINLTGNNLSQWITGTNGVNILSTGGVGPDTLTGLDGADIYRVFNAADIIVEGVGGGIDRVAAAVSFNLAGDDNIETLATNGSAGITAINLRGNALAQTLLGNAGANILNGLGGSDTITGFAGADTFAFNSVLGPTNVDIITDYSVAADHILLENAIFLGLAAGALSGTAFSSSIDGIATDATDRIMYETDTGFLWYDADGNSAGLRVKFADLAGGLVMSAGEFAIV